MSEQRWAREVVYKVIDGEREYQSTTWPNGEDKRVGEYLTLIRDYSAKADREWTSNPGDVPALHQIRKIAAIAVQCMEVHGALSR